MNQQEFDKIIDDALKKVDKALEEIDRIRTEIIPRNERNLAALRRELRLPD